MAAGAGASWWGGNACRSSGAEPDYRELGRRAATVGRIRGPADLFWVLAPVCEPAKRETAWGVALDWHARVVRVREIGQDGTASSVQVPMPALLRLRLGELPAPFLALAHNHPSGSAWPSVADADLWNDFRAAAHERGAVALDHLVIGCGEFFSFVEGQLWTAK